MMELKFEGKNGILFKIHRFEDDVNIKYIIVESILEEKSIFSRFNPLSFLKWYPKVTDDPLICIRLEKMGAGLAAVLAL